MAKSRGIPSQGSPQIFTEVKSNILPNALRMLRNTYIS
jgi:hypothetical protein